MDDKLLSSPQHAPPKNDLWKLKDYSSLFSGLGRKSKNRIAFWADKYSIHLITLYSLFINFPCFSATNLPDCMCPLRRPFIRIGRRLRLRRWRRGGGWWSKRIPHTSSSSSLPVQLRQFPRLILPNGRPTISRPFNLWQIQSIPFGWPKWCGTTQIQPMRLHINSAKTQLGCGGRWGWRSNSSNGNISNQKTCRDRWIQNFTWGFFKSKFENNYY